MGWLWLAGFVLAAAGVLAWRWTVGKRKPGYLAVCEYWVYAGDATVPKVERLIDAMVRGNPHSRPHRPAITTREGSLFTDLRLRISLVLRSKNPHAFRPDLFAQEVQPTAEVLERLGEAKCFVQCRYLSEVPLNDTRHLQFMPHLAAAVCRLVGGTVVFDTAQETLTTAEDLAALLQRNSDAERPDFHVRTVWRESPEGRWLETRGLVKLGVRELGTELQAEDERTIVEGIANEVVALVWADPAAAGPWDIEAFGAVFRAEIRPRPGPTRLLTLGRVRAAN